MLPALPNSPLCKTNRRAPISSTPISPQQSPRIERSTAHREASTTAPLYPPNPRDPQSPIEVRQKELERHLRQRAERLQCILYGDVSPVIQTTSSSSNPIDKHASTSTRTVDVKALYILSGDAVQNTLAAISKERSAVHQKRLGKRQKNTKEAKLPVASREDTSSFGFVDGVYIRHPHSKLLPWYVPKVAVPDSVRCAESVLGGDLRRHETNYMRQQRGEEPLQSEAGCLQSPQTPLPLTIREKRILQYNVHAQNTSFPSQLLFKPTVDQKSPQTVVDSRLKRQGDDVTAAMRMMGGGEVPFGKSSNM